MENTTIQTLSPQELEAVSGGISNDTGYGASLAASIFFTGVLLVPGIGATVALTAFSASLISSGYALHYGTH